MSKSDKKLTIQESKQKIYRYCAYQERSHQQVREKLGEWGLKSAEVDEVLTDLITQGFLNEERFARAFAGGHFRMKHWGRNKIVHALELKGVTKNCIREGLKEIDEETYGETLRQLLGKKWHQVDEPDTFVKRDKVASYAIQKGFEPEIVWSMIKEISD